MADTGYGVNNALAVKLWSKRLSVEALKQTWAYKFMGEDSGSLIQIKTETQKSAGDKVTFGLRMQLTGNGVLGDGTLMGNEEALATYSDAIYIDQLRNAVRSAGRMSDQRVPFSVREEALSGLKDWWADRIDFSFFNQACGNTAQTDVRWTGNQATVAPSTNHYLTQHGSGNDQNITSSDPFSITILDKAVERARTLTPAIRPIRIKDSDYYVAFLHPYQVTSLRTNTNTGQWLDIQKAAMTGGLVEENPIFDGALGVYNGVILHSDSRVTEGCDSSAPTTAVTTVRRAVFAGAQACMLGYGQETSSAETYDWVEELFDYGNQLGVSAGCIYGMKKTVFNSLDFSTIVMSSYAVAAS